MDVKVVQVDEVGWGDLLLGVVIGALEFPAYRYMERRIPTVYFQSPRFERKECMIRAVEIAREIVEVMRVDDSTLFRVCSGYILSSIQRYLRERGFRVQRTEITGDLQEKVEKGYVEWCTEVGVPRNLLSTESGSQRFWALLNWVKENPKLRERLVKTGWRSWSERWRDVAYSVR